MRAHAVLYRYSIDTASVLYRYCINTVSIPASNLNFIRYFLVVLHLLLHVHGCFKGIDIGIDIGMKLASLPVSCVWYRYRFRYIYSLLHKAARGPCPSEPILSKPVFRYVHARPNRFFVIAHASNIHIIFVFDLSSLNVHVRPQIF